MKNQTRRECFRTGCSKRRILFLLILTWLWRSSRKTTVYLFIRPTTPGDNCLRSWEYHPWLLLYLHQINLFWYYQNTNTSSSSARVMKDLCEINFERVLEFITFIVHKLHYSERLKVSLMCRNELIPWLYSYKDTEKKKNGNTFQKVLGLIIDDKRSWGLGGCCVCNNKMVQGFNLVTEFPSMSLPTRDPIIFCSGKKEERGKRLGEV